MRWRRPLHTRLQLTFLHKRLRDNVLRPRRGDELICERISARHCQCHVVSLRYPVVCAVAADVLLVGNFTSVLGLGPDPPRKDRLLDLVDAFNSSVAYIPQLNPEIPSYYHTLHTLD